MYLPERLCGGRVYSGRYIKCSTFTLFYLFVHRRMFAGGEFYISNTETASTKSQLTDKIAWNELLD